jgi:hypothetical protein
MSDGVRTQPGDQRSDGGGWKRIGVGAIQMKPMACTASAVASAASERRCLEAERKAELAVGSVRADVLGGQDRGPTANATHKFDGGADRTKLRGGRLGIL